MSFQTTMGTISLTFEVVVEYEEASHSPGRQKLYQSLDRGSQTTIFSRRRGRVRPWLQLPNGLKYESSHAKLRQLAPPPDQGEVGIVSAVIGCDAGAWGEKSCGVGPAKHASLRLLPFVLVATSWLNLPTR
jgi:hypothetical protein